jgi:hypothetical protein
MSKPTWQMSRRELAKVVAAHFGYYGKVGGWIYQPNGRPVAHGWDAFATRLGARIVEGQGVNWRAMGERLPVR